MTATSQTMTLDEFLNYGNGTDIWYELERGIADIELLTRSSKR